MKVFIREYEYFAFFTKVFEYEYLKKCIRILMNTKTNTFCPGLFCSVTIGPESFLIIFNEILKYFLMHSNSLNNALNHL